MDAREMNEGTLATAESNPRLDKRFGRIIM